ncbi:DNA-binding transcriptional regulator, LysR family [Monaibacterium marinum]|uniref:DNA-binding transcriptional regulator, LysR family n=1 Tax=Pontivivens marinum TaxID=1690039 RepID=A0A2C9CWH6_9RHOB|nr:LysR family transcriptional regulator [Monaibacterium marinum]SOH95627.1 DNA-binding transcriptional regulator, LysR family [Monaibacterium marinum]
MQTHSLETFFWVSRLSSFRRAAEQLNISQPTVSARIQGLEKELGVTLLHRDQSLTLTEQGHELLDYARKVLRLTEDLSFHKGTQPAEARLRIGANGPVTATWLMPLTTRLEETQPGLRLEIEVNQSATLLQHLATDQLDLGFLSEDPHDPRLRVERIGVYKMVWVAKPGLSSSHLSDAELMASPIISYGWQSPIHDHTHAPAFSVARHRRFLHTDSLFMMIRLVIDGAGLALLPHAAIANELASGALVIVEVETKPMDLPLLAARPRSKRSTLVDHALTLAKELMPAASPISPSIGRYSSTVAP